MLRVRRPVLDQVGVLPVPRDSSAAPWTSRSTRGSARSVRRGVLPRQVRRAREAARPLRHAPTRLDGRSHAFEPAEGDGALWGRRDSREPSRTARRCSENRRGETGGTPRARRRPLPRDVRKRAGDARRVRFRFVPRRPLRRTTRRVADDENRLQITQDRKRALAVGSSTRDAEAAPRPPAAAPTRRRSPRLFPRESSPPARLALGARETPPSRRASPSPRPPPRRPLPTPPRREPPCERRLGATVPRPRAFDLLPERDAAPDAEVVRERGVLVRQREVRAVRPSASVALASAPIPSRRLHADLCPSTAARISGVNPAPLRSRASTEMPPETMIASSSSARPIRAARCASSTGESDALSAAAAGRRRGVRRAAPPPRAAAAAVSRSRDRARPERPLDSAPAAAGPRAPLCS